MTDAIAPKMRTRLIIRQNGLDVSDEIELTKGRGLPGWQQYTMVHRDTTIGWLECGSPDFTVLGYTSETIEEPDVD